MTGRIFITGDKHGSLVPFFGLAQRNELTPADILLIAGDAGYVWREHDSSPLTTLQQLFPGTVAFVDGNHENHALLNRDVYKRQGYGGRPRNDRRFCHECRKCLSGRFRPVRHALWHFRHNCELYANPWPSAPADCGLPLCRHHRFDGFAG